MNWFKRLSLPSSIIILLLAFWFYPQGEMIAAGIAVFLFGLWMLKQGVQGLSGGLLETMLKKVTRSIPRAIGFGFVSTTLVQSSTLVMVLAISFLAAGMIPLATGLGVVIGTNIGTTTGTWLIASFGLSFSLSKLAMPILVFGVLFLFQSRPVNAAIGQLLLGMGFLFLGIDYIKEGFASVQGSINLASLAPQGFIGLLALTLLGFVITVILQSSHATILLTLSALAAEQITLNMASAFTIGACIGTTVIPLLSSLSANVAGKRLASAHSLFNLMTAIVALPLLPVLLPLVSKLAGVLGIHEQHQTLHLALFHTSFSLLGSVMLLPNIKRFRALLAKLLPEPELPVSKVQFITQAALESPATAVVVTRSETIHLFELASGIMINGLGWQTQEFHQDKPLTQLSELNKNAIANVQVSYELHIKDIYSEVIGFISAAREKATDINNDLLRELWAANFHIVEAIKGVRRLQHNMQQYLPHSNPHIAGAYRDMRHQIGEVMRAIEYVKSIPDPVESRLILDHQQLITERIRDESNTIIETLIRERKVTTHMATSLMTDKGYANKVCLNLLSVGRFLFIDADKPQAQAPDSLNLDAEDLNEINQHIDDQRQEFAAEENR